MRLPAIHHGNLFLLYPLIKESKAEGFRFVERTLKEWETGENTFSGPGEKLWGLAESSGLVGTGGLNQDPNSGSLFAGRVRHLYIRQSYRRKKYATLLMKTIVHQARHHFEVLSLFTDQPGADAFYQAFGFVRTEGYKIPHVLHLSKETEATFA